MLAPVLGLAGFSLACVGAYEMATDKSLGLFKLLGIQSKQVGQFRHCDIEMMVGGAIMALAALA